jgi:site-specific DNA-methyltransferase (adenine-specific)
MTPYFDRDGITIYCGEASEVMGQFAPGSIDLTVTSPPYDNLRTYNGYTFDFEAIAGQLWRVTAAGGVVVWVVGDATINGSETGTSFRQALGFMGLGFNLHDTMIYEKNGAEFSRFGHTKYPGTFEYMFVFCKGRNKSFTLIKDKPNKKAGITIWGSVRLPDGTQKPSHSNGREVSECGCRGNVWCYDAGFMLSSKDEIAFNHPAIFPEALARDHIISWSNPGDLVCDPMLGSGTTAKMAQHLGRRFVGCDISEEYCRIAVDRLRQPSFFSLPSQPTKVEVKQEAMNL